MKMNARLFVRMALATVMACVACGAQAAAAKVIRIGEIEAETGPYATYGWMSAQGLRLAVHEVNASGGFRVAGQLYRLQLTQDDTRGEPREGVVQFKQLMQDNVHFVFGPFLSNIYQAIHPIALQNSKKFLMFAGATAAHGDLGKPGNEFLLRTFAWDGGADGFGKGMVDLLKQRGVKNVAMLYPNDAVGRLLGGIYAKLFQQAGIKLEIELFEPGTKDFTAALSKLALDKPQYLFPGYTDGVLYDVVRQATNLGLFRKFFIVRGSIAPALKNKDAIDDYIAYTPKYFEQAEKTSKPVARFIDEYKAYYHSPFPYAQAPLCVSSCYDQLYMLIDAMKKAGTTTDLPAIRKQLIGMHYDGLWRMTFDPKGEEVFDYDIVEVTHGGRIHVIEKHMVQ